MISAIRLNIVNNSDKILTNQNIFSGTAVYLSFSCIFIPVKISHKYRYFIAYRKLYRRFFTTIYRLQNASIKNLSRPVNEKSSDSISSEIKLEDYSCNCQYSNAQYDIGIYVEFFANVSCHFQCRLTASCQIIAYT